MTSNLFSFSNHQIYLITAQENQKQSGMIATWVMPGSFAKNKIRTVIAFTKGNFTTSLIQNSKKFVLHLLSEDQLSLLPLFGGHSSTVINKFENLSLDHSKTEGPIINGCCGWLTCEIKASLDGGDRLIVVADALDGSIDETKKPLFKREAFEKLSSEERTHLEEKYTHDSARDATLFSEFVRLI